MGIFGRKKQEEKPARSPVEKIIMGAIIGTAIGSVVGRSMATRSGKETRDRLKDQYKKQMELFDLKKESSKAHQDDLEEITQLTKETVSGFGTLIKRLIFGKKNRSESALDSRPHKTMKQIPVESPEVIKDSKR